MNTYHLVFSLTTLFVGLTSCVSLDSGQIDCHTQSGARLENQGGNGGGGGVGGEGGGPIAETPISRPQAEPLWGGTLDGCLTLGIPENVTVVRLREVSGEAPIEGAHLCIRYLASSRSSSTVQWIFAREGTSGGGHWIASIGWADSISTNDDMGAELDFVFISGHWTLGAYSGSVNVGPDASP